MWLNLFIIKAAFGSWLLAFGLADLHSFVVDFMSSGYTGFQISFGRYSS
jgi:hypothetical protein